MIFVKSNFFLTDFYLVERNIILMKSNTVIPPFRDLHFFFLSLIFHFPSSSFSLSLEQNFFANVTYSLKRSSHFLYHRLR